MKKVIGCKHRLALDEIAIFQGRADSLKDSLLLLGDQDIGAQYRPSDMHVKLR